MTSGQTGNPYAWWNLRCWHGMGFRTWMKLLFQGPGTVSSSRVGLVFTVTGFSLMNSLLSPKRPNGPFPCLPPPLPLTQDMGPHYVHGRQKDMRPFKPRAAFRTPVPLNPKPVTM